MSGSKWKVLQGSGAYEYDADATLRLWYISSPDGRVMASTTDGERARWRAEHAEEARP